MKLNQDFSGGELIAGLDVCRKPTAVLDYIPLMEREFNRVETIIGKELTPAAAYHYYDFYDMACEIKRMLKEKRLAVKEAWGREMIEKNVATCDQLGEMTLWNILINMVNIDHMDHGYLEKKIKDKTILKILRALKDSFR
ncbi:hypothetical protein [Echinicola vietnamensis]|uniref:Uncharacterized protein n=1 Tax=Echinicola vietnamensis (strain DSM 17526 / LMG 23754 / KMM 6221) TaxID=926556 RepID=L0G3S3_ECHVK|nr:hypothetical protein [Echinicola vietnamensis]AGA79958.1 hypothetical protein Echvi_3746 [Echinicola vietnamensis DSM 17526]